MSDPYIPPRVRFDLALSQMLMEAEAAGFRRGIGVADRIVIWLDSDAKRCDVLAWARRAIASEEAKP